MFANVPLDPQLFRRRSSMAKEKEKGKESKAVSVKTPVEVMPRGGEIDRWFDRLTEDFWRRPLSKLILDEQWTFHIMSIKYPSLYVFDEKDDLVVMADLPGLSK